MRDVRFLEVYQDVFFAGKNFGKKIITKNVAGLSLAYNEEKDWFEMGYQGRKGYLKQNSAFWEFEEGVEPAQIKNESVMPNPKVKAQVSGPHDHVFAGEGQGRVRNK